MAEGQREGGFLCSLRHLVLEVVEFDIEGLLTQNTVRFVCVCVSVEMC